MPFLVVLLAANAIAFGQDPPQTAPPAQESAVVVPAVTVVVVSVAPLAPPDLTSPYASPRDAARHRLQATLADLASNRNIKEALRGFAQAFLADRTYALAAFNLGIVAAIAEKWDDAVAALDEAVRLDPGTFKAAAAPQLERLRLIASLEKSSEGKRKHRYDEALLPLLDQLPDLSLVDANSALAELGRIDPKRWEAPGMLAGLNGDGRGYETATKFLEVALRNASEPSAKAGLENALRTAERELRYSSTRTGAEAAADSGDYSRAAELYQTAWTAIPARSVNGMEAASALLLCDDAAGASTLLARLRDSGDASVDGLAGAMLKELEPIEPTAKAPTSDASKFFRDPGSREPVRIATLIPPVDRKPLELYFRPLPKLVDDPEPVVLLASLAVEAPTATATLPALPLPSIAGESPWRELTSIKAVAASEVTARTPRAIQTADLAGNLGGSRVLQVTSEPPGARIFIGGSPESACETPCNVRLASGEGSVRFSLTGYQDAEQVVQLTSDIQDLAVPLTPLRGSVLVETSAPATLKVNGTLASLQSPAELSLIPGLYRIGADFGSATREILLTIKPGARLRLEMGH